MAYRTRRAAPRRTGRSRVARSGARRTYAARGGRRVSRGARSGPQTVRVVIEQAPPSAVARDPLGSQRMQVETKPQKAKF